jgi:hypothetical protein
MLSRVKPSVLLPTALIALTSALSAQATSEVLPPPKLDAGFEVSPMVLLFGAPTDHLAGGVDVYGGVRFSKWLSLEGYAGVVVDSQSRSESYGACCQIDNWRWWWGRFGGRIWLHAIHAPRFELLVGLGLGASIVAQHDTVRICGTYPQNTICNLNTVYPALDAAFLLGFEVHIVRELGFRAIGSVGTTGPLSLVLAASLGPVAHF